MKFGSQIPFTSHFGICHDRCSFLPFLVTLIFCSRCFCLFFHVFLFIIQVGFPFIQQHYVTSVLVIFEFQLLFVFISIYPLSPTYPIQRSGAYPKHISRVINCLRVSLCLILLLLCKVNLYLSIFLFHLLSLTSCFICLLSLAFTFTLSLCLD